MTDKEAIVSLFTYLVICNEKVGIYGTEELTTPRLFTENYYENAVTHCMMKLRVDEKAMIRSACHTINGVFDKKFRRTLFSQLARFIIHRNQSSIEGLREIYEHLDLCRKPFEAMLGELSPQK